MRITKNFKILSKFVLILTQISCKGLNISRLNFFTIIILLFRGNFPIDVFYFSEKIITDSALKRSINQKTDYLRQLVTNLPEEGEGRGLHENRNLSISYTLYYRLQRGIVQIRYGCTANLLIAEYKFICGEKKTAFLIIRRG